MTHRRRPPRHLPRPIPRPLLAGLILGLFLPGLLTCAACGGSADPHPSPAPSPSPRVADSAPDPGSPSGSSENPRVVFLGDSLTAGFGLAEEQAFPAVVEERLKTRGLPVEVINAGVSGDTSAGGRARVDWVLRQEPDVLVVGLGANDGLRGISPEATEENLRAIVRRARQGGARVVLLGMKIPPNYGPEYTAAFEAVYPRIAEDLEVPLVPFLLEGVGGEPEFNLPDGIHPDVEGHRRVAENVLPVLLPVLLSLVREKPDDEPGDGLSSRVPVP